MLLTTRIKSHISLVNYTPISFNTLLKSIINLGNLSLLICLVFNTLCTTKVYAQNGYLQENTPLKSNKVKTSVQSLYKGQNTVQRKGENKRQYPEHLSDKFYRQALYFYFQNKPEQTLRQLNINNEYFAASTVHTSLFKVGLQISQGLPQHAQVLLEDISKDLSPEVPKANNRLFKGYADHSIIQSNSQKEELMIIVLLQLAEKKIEQQDNKGAASILANIRVVPREYLSQYYLLQQLIAWPQQPNIENLKLDANSKKQLVQLLNNDKQAPYLLLNEALGAINHKEFNLAEKKLSVLKAFSRDNNPNSFWQQLFSEQRQGSQKNVEQDGINHYAQLLLAQVYIEQGNYTEGYNQLESFPKHTSFTEQALFLFGYSALRLGRFTASEVIFNTLITDYPYSTFTQQAWVLNAEQYVVQNKFDMALDKYLLTEEYYENKLQDIAAYKVALINESNLLNLYHSQQNNQISPQGLVSQQTQPNHILWINTSLKHKGLAKVYQQLLSVDNLVKQLESQQTKSDWLATTIKLNSARQQKVKENQSRLNYPHVLKKLSDQTKQLTALLANAKSTNISTSPYLGNGELFANNLETKWLQRIESSKNSLDVINTSSDKNTEEYIQRLKRVKGVLNWQLQQKFPDRFWRSQQGLNDLENLYAKTKEQHKKVNELLLQESTLTRLSHEQKNLTTSIVSLLEKTKQLKVQLNKGLLKQNLLFIKNEQDKIQQYLLFNQRAMANVIERLNKQEAL
jgi:hypothetical protein